MFRKSKTASSVLDPNAYKIRHTGDFIYEQFFQPQHRADVKVYAVGDYYHAESRKAPHVDGIVERDSSGRERRTPERLSEQELHICRRVSSAFDQFVVGFDLLRAVDSQHFIIDVNGWSVVKNSDDYSLRAGQILATYIAQKVNERTSGDASPASSNLLLDASRRPDLFDPSHGRGSPCPA
ncbi:Histidine acid phosphatase VIP1 [Gracilaria domingensis]|nr:Histidine acid phosphatase VIP1 [Gracilaria domingensis]